MGMSQSAKARLDVDGTKICFVRIKDMTRFSLVDGSESAICGSLYHDKNRVDIGIVMPKLQILLQPTPEELDVILPWIGFIESADVFTPTEDFSATPLPLILDRVATVDDLGNAYVDKAIFRGQKGTHPLAVELHVYCDAAPDVDGETFDADAPGTLTAPYPLHRAVLTAEGGVKSFDSFMYLVDNHLAVQHNNSIAPTDLQPSHVTHHLGISTPYTSNETVLLTNPIDSAAGAAGSIVFTRDTQSTTFAFTNLKSEANPPDIPGKSGDPLESEIRLKMFYNSYASGTTKPVVITHDATV